MSERTIAEVNGLIRSSLASQRARGHRNRHAVSTPNILRSIDPVERGRDSPCGAVIPAVREGRGSGPKRNEPSLQRRVARLPSLDYRLRIPPSIRAITNSHQEETC